MWNRPHHFSKSNVFVNRLQDSSAGLAIKDAPYPGNDEAYGNIKDAVLTILHLKILP